MKNLITRKTLLGLALLGTFVAAPLAGSTAHADPKDGAPAYGRRAKDKKDKRDKRRDDRRDERREDYDRDRYDRDSNYRDRYDRGNIRNSDTLTGQVTNVRSGNSFDLNSGGRVYNVYVAGQLPRGLSRGDQVRVSGQRYGDNDLRRASVSILTNNRNDPRRDDRYSNDDRPGYTNGRYDPNGKLGRNGNYNNGNYGNGNNGNNGNGNNAQYQNYTGVVTDVRNDRDFDVRIGASTYNVTATSSTRGLNRGDIVRVYGQRYGVNDIRNANVIVTRDSNRNDGLDPNRFGRYETFRGEVTQVRNDRDFDVRFNGQTYNVTASSGTRGLSRGDEVRIYGRRYGVNDIRNANVTITRNR